MTLQQIETLVKSGESETLEFKRTTGERREAARALCAMLNHRGGCVLFGIEPDGRVLGQQVSDRTLEEITQEVQQIEPTIFPQIDRVEVRVGLQVVSVTVTAVRSAWRSIRIGWKSRHREACISVSPQRSSSNRTNHCRGIH